MKCRGKPDTTWNIPPRSRFPCYISCYIAESRLHLGQCRPTVICTEEAPWAQPGMDENFPNWCGNISSLVWKFFVLIPMKNVHTRGEKFQHKRKKFHTRDNKFPHQSRNISKTEQKSKENILEVGCGSRRSTVRKIFLFQKRKIFVSITIIFTVTVKKFE